MNGYVKKKKEMNPIVFSKIRSLSFKVSNLSRWAGRVNDELVDLSIRVDDPDGKGAGLSE